MKTILITLFFLSTYPLLGQTTLNVKTFGGAAGNGQADDTQAIQQTIDAVSEAGGGTVFFPEGTYRVSPVAAPGFRQTVCLRIPSDIEMKGESKAKAIIKVMDSVIHYDGIIGPFPSFARIENFTLRDMTLDGNGTNNPVTQEILNQGTSHTMLRIFLADNLLVDNCRFTDHKGIWIITFNGLIDGATVRNCTFEQIGDKSVDWDHSTIYTNGQNFRIYNNTFSTRFGAGTFGARAAIETHGKNQWVANNRIDGFVNGMNITGYSTLTESKNQVVVNNVMTNVLIGIRLWAGSFGDSLQEITPNGLEDVLLMNNTITVNVRDWTELSFFNGGSGISFERDNDRKTENLFVYQNQISFLNTLPLEIGSARQSVGILAGSQVLDPSVPINNWYISTNTIRNSLGPGISLESVVNGASVVNNTIINPGNNQGDLFNAFRSGFFLSNTLNQVRINDNRITDNRSPALTDHVGITYTDNAPSSYFFDNTDNLPAIQGLTVTDETAGTAWKITPDLPVVSFAADSSAVGAASFTLNLTVAAPSSSPLTVGVKVLNPRSNVEDGLYLLSETFTMPANATTYQLPLTLDAKFLTEDNRPLVVLDQSPDYITGRYTFTRLVESSSDTEATLSGTYELHPASAPDKVLEVAVNRGNGDNVRQGIDRNQANQRWLVTALDNGYYRLTSVSNPKQCLDVAGRGTTNGTNVQTWKFNPNGQANQEWKMVREDAEKGYYSLAPRHTEEQGLARRLDVRWASTTDGANVWLYTSNGTQAQRFVLEKVSEDNARNAQADSKSKHPEEETDSQTLVYPNPSADGQFILQGVPPGSQIWMYDLQGRSIAIITQAIVPQRLQVQPRRNLPKGLYLLQVEQLNGQWWQGKVAVE